MKKIRILIAENDEDEQLFMKDGFDQSGRFEIMAFADSGDELLTLLHQQDRLPDIILSDLNMPGKNGYDVLQELRADSRYASLPIVITSTSSMQSVVDTCMQLGATEFMKKPDTFIEYASFAHKLSTYCNT